MAGGGVGEAALMGAAIGGGTSILTGKDPLKGALLGGLGGYAFSPASGMTSIGADAMAGAGFSPAATAIDAALPAVGSQQAMLEAQTAGMFDTPAASEMLANQTLGANAGANAGIGSLPTGPISQDRTSRSFWEDPLSWMKNNRGKTAAGALGLYGLANMGNLMKPNYMTPYQPPTAQQYGLGAQLAPGYRPTIAMQSGGTVEQMSNANSIGQNTGYPQADITKGAYATPWQTPISRNMLEGAADTGVDPISGQMRFADGGGITGLMKYAKGGMSDLGSYSDGGRMLRGPGDGMSDSIPASIDGKQPARLADGEFVVPSDVVSHLGNGSTDAGARQLYKMMDKVRTARTGRKSQGKQINPKKYMPA